MSELRKRLEEVKPCPFCGKNLIWVEDCKVYFHPDKEESDNCILSCCGDEREEIPVLVHPDDVEDWNRRAKT